VQNSLRRKFKTLATSAKRSHIQSSYNLLTTLNCSVICQLSTVWASGSFVPCSTFHRIDAKQIKSQNVTNKRNNLFIMLIAYQSPRQSSSRLSIWSNKKRVTQRPTAIYHGSSQQRRHIARWLHDPSRRLESWWSERQWQLNFPASKRFPGPADNAPFRRFRSNWTSRTRFPFFVGGAGVKEVTILSRRA